MRKNQKRLSDGFCRCGAEIPETRMLCDACRTEAMKRQWHNTVNRKRMMEALCPETFDAEPTGRCSVCGAEVFRHNSGCLFRGVWYCSKHERNALDAIEQYMTELENARASCIAMEKVRR